MKTAYCFDLCGTLVRQELLPLVAESLGLEDEISVLTQATNEGLLPFDKSFKLRVRLLRDACLGWVQSTLEEQIQFDPAILEFILVHPQQAFVLTGNLDVWVRPILDKLGIQSFCSQARLGEDGQLDGVERILHKGDAAIGLRDRFDRIIAVGAGMNDVSMFEAADWRIAFGGVQVPNQILVRLSDFVTYDGRALCRLLNTL